MTPGARGRYLALLVQAGEDRTRGLGAVAVRERLDEAARVERRAALQRRAWRVKQDMARRGE